MSSSKSKGSAKDNDTRRNPGGDEETGLSSDTDRDEEALTSRYTTYKEMHDNSHLHMLTSYHVGASKVERLARKIDDRITERIEVTFNARKTFLKTCKKIAERQGYDKLSRVKFSDILELRQRVKEDAESNDAEGFFSRCFHFFGVLNDLQCLNAILEKAVARGNALELRETDDFHYQVRLR